MSRYVHPYILNGMIYDITFYIFINFEIITMVIISSFFIFIYIPILKCKSNPIMIWWKIKNKISIFNLEHFFTSPIWNFSFKSNYSKMIMSINLFPIISLFIINSSFGINNCTYTYLEHYSKLIKPFLLYTFFINSKEIWKNNMMKVYRL